MARPLRIEFAGALYHLTSRGDRREPIYEDDEDREIFLDVLAGGGGGTLQLALSCVATVGRIVRRTMQ